MCRTWSAGRIQRKDRNKGHLLHPRQQTWNLKNEGLVDDFPFPGDFQVPAARSRFPGDFQVLKM